MNERKIDDVPAEWNRVTEQVIGAAMEVHSVLGPGLLERLYEDALCVELALRGIPFRRQAPIKMSYKGVSIGDQLVDLLVSDFLVLELKAVEKVSEMHLAQLVSYLRSGGMPLGLPINFHSLRLKDGIFRRANSINIPVPTAVLSELLPPRPSASSASSAFISSSNGEP